MSEEKKYLDEEDVSEEEIQEKDSLEEEETTEPEPELEEEPLDDEVEGDDEVEEEPESEEEVVDESWMDKAKEQGWVPDHVRAKHAREAQTLRDQNEMLNRILNAQKEEVDPNEIVRQGDLDGVLDNINRNIEAMRDPALLSETIMRTQVPDYDEVIIGFVEPLAADNPWLEGILRQETNPAGAAYNLGCALRDGRKVGFAIKDGRMAINIEEEPTTPKPKKKDPSRPPVEALEQAKKQPKSLDEIPTATEDASVEMSVEDFWRLPTDTLIRLRTEKPELYEKMRNRSNEKYG